MVGVPLDLYPAARRIIGRKVGHCSNYNRIDADQLGQLSRLIGPVELKAVPLRRLFDDADRDDFKPRNRLQRREIGFAELPAIDGRLAAQIEKRRHRNLGELRERIVNLRLLHRARKQPTAANQNQHANGDRQTHHEKANPLRNRRPPGPELARQADNPGTSRVIDRIDAVSLI